MCGRYTLATPDPAAVRERFPVGESVEIRTRYNVAPGDEVLAVTTDRDGHPRGELFRWGLVPSWAERPDDGLKMINARVETVAQRPAFRSAFERFRCLVIADGFYEWNRTPGGQKQAFHIRPLHRGLFAFAGLWSIWRRDGQPARRTCTILTRPANDSIAPLHDRMPIILAAERESAWLDPGSSRQELLSMLGGLAAPETSLAAVGPAVNDARYDGPACLSPPLWQDQKTLF